MGTTLQIFGQTHSRHGFKSEFQPLKNGSKSLMSNNLLLLISHLHLFCNKPENLKDVPFPHKNRLASGVEDLKNNLHYIASLRRQIIGWGLRIFMLICKNKKALTFSDNL